MDDRDQISDRAFYDVLNEKYEHCDITGTLSKRSDNRQIKADTMRAMIRGKRKTITATKFVFWLYSGKVPDRPVKPIDGNYCNLRFDNLELFKTTAERFEEQQKLWLHWCHLSEEERIEYEKTKPKPSPPVWGR